MFAAPQHPRRILLIVAPSLFECYHAARANGLTPPHIENFRNVTKAHQLRGVRDGTPFIAINRDSWPATPEGEALSRALDLCLRIGRVRIAQDRDLKACRPFDDIPKREARR